MIRIIDTYEEIDSLFIDGLFSHEKWETYINFVYSGSAKIFVNDLNECLNSGNYTYEKDVLPIINAVYKHHQLEMLHSSFCKVTNDLNAKISMHFDCELDVDIVLYVGLCNAAGWVTNINGRDVILLGVEKILELNWYDENSMYGLIYHELGHVYHNQYGKLDQKHENKACNFVWQLFTEGIAMYFEQSLVDDYNYYHQDKNGWLKWCDNHFHQILADFYHDLDTMTIYNQRYFGDWANYNGQGDVGYYLGAKFVQELCTKYRFQELINFDIAEIHKEYVSFAISKL